MVLLQTADKDKSQRSFFGALRRGNKPPVQPGENKKALAKENLRV